jgi:hypothetical protein
LLGYSWLVRARWDGLVGIYWIPGVDQVAIEQMVRGALVPAWSAAEEILSLYEPQGPRFFEAAFVGGYFRRMPDMWNPEPMLPVVARGPLTTEGVDWDVALSIERELARATGQMAYEP